MLPVFFVNLYGISMVRGEHSTYIQCINETFDMLVENKIVYRIIRPLDFKVGDRLLSRCENKIAMEDILEDVRRKSFSQMPSRRLSMFVIPSVELADEWASRLYFHKPTDYYLLKLSLIGDLVWLDSDKLTTMMTEETAAEYWSSELSEQDLTSTDIVPEGLFIGSAKIEEVILKHHQYQE